MTDLQIRTELFTCLVTINEKAVITEIAPLLRKFHGQPLRNLIRWCKKYNKEVILYTLSKST